MHQVDVFLDHRVLSSLTEKNIVEHWVSIISQPVVEAQDLLLVHGGLCLFAFHEPKLVDVETGEKGVLIHLTKGSTPLDVALDFFQFLLFILVFTCLNTLS